MISITQKKQNTGEIRRFKTVKTTDQLENSNLTKMTSWTNNHEKMYLPKNPQEMSGPWGVKRATSIEALKSGARHV